ncbi:MAG TPA: bile acid:sodium symporter family protein [Bacillota bacterium]|nr:bile acid:sodium symporter family protein [Bacillota bacterium]
MKVKLDGFLIGMAVAVGLAWLFPNPGAHGGALHPELLNKLGIALIFFLHGLALSFAALKAGTLRWPLHLVVQVCTFGLFPALGLLLLWLVGGQLAPDLKLGFFYLCALPSTVSSSVAMTATARGNVPAAVFNATLSSLLGVFLTPFWMGWMLQRAGHPMPLGKVLLDLVTWLVLPLALGQLCRPWLGVWAARNKQRISLVDRATILLLVYTSFCDSMKWGVWSGQGVGTALLTLVGSALIFYIVFSLVGFICDRLAFPAEDKIAAVFCGSKKTLASGIPMAQLIFSSHPGLSLILLPILIYHPLQLVICGTLAQKWARAYPGRPQAPAQA